MDYRELLRRVRAALQAGEKREAIEAEVRALTGMSIDELALAAAKGKTPMTDLAMSVGQGASFDFLDELAGLGTAVVPGGKGYREGRDAFRTRYEQIDPGVRLAGELVGGFAVPAGLFGAAGRATSLPRAVGRGIGAGAAAGGLAAAGGAENLGDVPLETAFGVGVGGTVGGLFAGVPGVVRSMAGGTGAQRLSRAVGEVSTPHGTLTGPDALRQLARQAERSGYGRVAPIASLSPFLSREAEFAATRAPDVKARYGQPLARTRAGEAERLIRGVSEVTGTPQVGREAIAAARANEFEPLYAAIERGPNRLLRPAPSGTVRADPKLWDFLGRPYVSGVYTRMVEEGLIAGQDVSQPGFRALHRLMQELRDAADAAYTAGQGGRGTALKEAVGELDGLLQDGFPDYRAVQTAYRKASVPVNVIDLARLEVARQGRAAAGLDKASRDLRRELLRAFGSAEQYRAFMARVAQEANLAELQQTAFGGSATAGRMLGESGMEPADLAQAGVRAVTTSTPTSAVGGMLSGAVPKAIRERAARQMAPLLFRPSREVEKVLAQIEAMRRRQAVGPLGSLVGPAGAGAGAINLFSQ